MKIAVYGPGGAGGYFGARLARSGQDVVFIARGDHLEAIRNAGLRVDSVKGDFVLHPAKATDNPASVGPVDMILLGVKAWQVPELASTLSPLVGPDTAVLPLQNGVETAGQLSGVLGPNHVMGGLAKIISYKVAPGYIRHIGAEPYIALGELDGQYRKRTERIRLAIEGAGITVEVPADIQAAVWEKFLFVVSWGGVGAVTRSPIGVIRSVPETRRMLEQSMEEIFALAVKRSIAMAGGTVKKAMVFVDTLPPNGTASLQRDIDEGKPSELDAWNGAVVRLGQDASVPVPLNSFIYHSLLPQEMRAREKLTQQERCRRKNDQRS